MGYASLEDQKSLSGLGYKVLVGSEFLNPSISGAIMRACQLSYSWLNPSPRATPSLYISISPWCCSCCYCLCGALWQWTQPVNFIWNVFLKKNNHAQYLTLNWYAWLAMLPIRVPNVCDLNVFKQVLVSECCVLVWTVTKVSEWCMRGIRDCWMVRWQVPW